MKAKIIPIVRWAIAILLLIMAAGGFTMNVFAGLMFLLAAFCVSPLFDKIPKIGEKFGEKAGYRVLAVIALFFAGVFMIPTEDKDEDEPEVVPDRAIVAEDITTEPETAETSTNTTTTLTSSTTTTPVAATSSTTSTETTTSTTTTTTTTTTVAATTTAIITTAQPTTAYIPPQTTVPVRQNNYVHFILNTETNCVHLKSSCRAAEKILPGNWAEIDIAESDIPTYEGVYWACGICARSYTDELPKP